MSLHHDSYTETTNFISLSPAAKGQELCCVSRLYRKCCEEPAVSLQLVRRSEIFRIYQVAKYKTLVK